MSDDTFDESILGSMRLPKKLTPEEEAMESPQVFDCFNIEELSAKPLDDR